jgi:hypothetical protein
VAYDHAGRLSVEMINRQFRAAGGSYEEYGVAVNPPWIRALAEVRHMGTREGYCYHHVQAIMIAIDQYAETALSNRNYFLNRPHGIGGMKDDIP